MSVNDSALCRAVKKLHGIAPTTPIDDPLKVESLMVSFMAKPDWGALCALDEYEEKEVVTWMRAAARTAI
jgi:hypothetical protein